MIEFFSTSGEPTCTKIYQILTRDPWATLLTWEKQFKSINTYDYIIMLIKRRKKNTSLLLGELIGSSFEQTWIPFTKGCFVPSLVEIGSVVLEKKIFNFFQWIFAISYNYLPLESSGPFIWTDLNPLHPRMLRAKFDRNWFSGSGEEFILISSMHFHNFVILSPLKRAGPLFQQNWIPFIQGCYVQNLVEIGSVVLEKKICRFRQCIFAIS